MLVECVLSLLLAPATDGHMQFLVVGRVLERSADKVTADFGPALKRLAASGMTLAPGATVLTADADQCMTVELK